MNKQTEITKYKKEIADLKSQMDSAILKSKILCVKLEKYLDISNLQKKEIDQILNKTN